MEVIDTHVHIWPGGTTPPKIGAPYGGPADAGYLVGEMDRAGVAASVLITPRAMGTDNSYARAAMQAYPERYVGVAGVVDYRSPVTEGRRLVREAAEEGLDGIRLHPCFDPDLDISAPELDPIWDGCATAGLHLLIHADPAQYGQVERLLERRPELTVLMDHLGRLPLGSGQDSVACRQLMGLARFPEVHLKISSVPWLLRDGIENLNPYVEAALAAYGPDRLLWGADWPVLCGVGWSYADTVAQALRLPLGPAEMAAFLGGNARRLYSRGT